MMELLPQLLSYGPWWLVFATVAYLTARFLHWGFIPLGHLAVGSMIFYLEVRALRVAMNQPDWNGTPAADVAFLLGLIVHILWVNTLLLPLSGWAARQRKRSPRANAPV